MERSDIGKLGFPYWENIILLFEGGSKLHGAKLDGTDDTDWYGVYVEPPEKILGVDSFEHFVYTTGSQRGQNKPDDIDITLYGLNKWASLACKGNPSVLHFLFVPNERIVFEHMLWAKLSMRREIFLAKSHFAQFMGYANAQLKRLYNQRANDVNRPALEAQHGYDTKYAMHIFRLLGEAKEYMETGKVTLPRPNKEELIAIRRGEWMLSDLLAKANILQQEAISARDTSGLPEKVDRMAISKIVAETYRASW
jgi:uncharacterized protein